MAQPRPFCFDSACLSTRPPSHQSLPLHRTSLPLYRTRLSIFPSPFLPLHLSIDLPLASTDRSSEVPGLPQFPLILHSDELRRPADTLSRCSLRPDLSSSILQPPLHCHTGDKEKQYAAASRHQQEHRGSQGTWFKMESQFFRFLKVVGVGFKARAEAGGRLLYLRLGYSHEVELTVPPAVRVYCFKPNIICCTGIDKHRTHQFAATVRSCKPPEVYKGKGILYTDEVIKLKPGKKSK